ncbi:hypothetical protein a10_09283 [Streptomyces acidiscabies]|nr:hypothetical protein a10_09283 [Streptomyces acidiscabies]
MAAEVEEAVLDADPLDTERFREEVAQDLFLRGAGASFAVSWGKRSSAA